MIPALVNGEQRAEGMQVERTDARPGGRIHYKLHGAALVFFGLTAFITLYPQIFHSGAQGAGYDWFFPHWAFWWVRHALSTDGLDLYHSNFVMFPYTTNYAYNVLTLFWFPVWAVLEPLIGTLDAVTVIIFAGCVLNGYLFFVFLRGESVVAGPALIGGLALQIFPIVRYFYYNTHINLMNWFLIPALLMIWKCTARATDSNRQGRALAGALRLGGALGATGRADLQFPIFAVFVLGPYGLWLLWRSPRRGRQVMLAALALGLALGLLWIAGPLRYLDDVDGTMVPGPVEDRPTIDFPTDFLTMAATWWDWSTPSLGAFVGAAVLIALVVALWRAPRRAGDHWLWLVVLLPPLVLAIGPTLTIGEWAIPMPYRLLYDLTDGNYRMPWRLGPAFVLGAMVFVGKVWSKWLPRSAARRSFLLGGAVFLLLLDLNFFTGGPMRPVLPGYRTYAAMGADPYDYVVVEVPTGAGSGEVLLGDAEAIAFQYYGITHGKRMVNGFVSRAPVEHFWSLHVDDPMLAWLGQRRLLEAETVEAQLRERIFGWPIGYLVVHQDYIRRNGAQPLEVTGFLNGLNDLLCPPIVEGDALFYRTAWHPDGCTARIPPEVEPSIYRVDVGSTGDERYLGWGWHWQETVAGLTLRWAGDQPQARVYVDLPPGAYELAISMQAFDEPREVTVRVNGQPAGEAVRVQPDSLGIYTFRLPADLIGEGQHLALDLSYDGWLVPAEIGHSQDQRRLSVAVDWLQFSRAEE